MKLRTWVGRHGRVLTIVLLVTALLAVTVGIVLAVDVDGNELVFVSRVFTASDPDNGGNPTTTFTYQMTSASSPALSHWTLEMCIDKSDIVKVTEQHLEPEPAGSVIELFECGLQPCWEFGNDPTTGVSGLKIESGYADGEKKEITIKLNGDVPLSSEKLDVGTKNGVGGGAGSGVKTEGAIDGPSGCEAEPTAITLGSFQATPGGGPSIWSVIIHRIRAIFQ